MTIFVSAECEDGIYGENCESLCNSRCKQPSSGRTCDKVTGDCVGGCKDITQPSHNDWWLGNKCDIFIRESKLCISLLKVCFDYQTYS